MRRNGVHFILIAMALCSLPLSALAEPLLPPVDIQKPTSLSSIQKITVNKFLFLGNQTIGDKELHQLALPYENRTISADELQELRVILSRYYIAKGYINSGVIVDDQAIDRGQITLRIVEGRVSEIRTSGLQRLNRNYVEQYLFRHSHLRETLNVGLLQQGLYLLKQDPRISTVHAKLEPTAKMGEAVLNVQVEEADAFHLSFFGNNHGAPALGTWRGGIHIEHLNLTGNGDSLKFDHAQASGLKDYNVEYRLPLNSARTTLSFQASLANSLVVSQPFNELDIRSESQSQRITLSHPLWINNRNELSISLAYEHKRNATTLLNIPFSFSSGVVNGKVHTNSLHFGQAWAHHASTRVIATSSQFTLGLAPKILLNADGKYIAWLGQGQWIERWSLLNSQSTVRSSIRLSNDRMMAVDKFALGGVNTVRGYRENQLTMDNAAVLNLEWNWPLFMLPILGLSHGKSDGSVALITFFDYARGWNRVDNSAELRVLSSAGLGLMWKITNGYNFEIYAGKPLRKVSRSGSHTLQDSGIHMQFTAQVL